ncbi:uncharacterized protein LODBEIA_P58200 [Lodderomyces beijingensis]|uniref:Telomere length regulation protein conserved domain-containing protein n=1 Tax=Lodderomyces beijingensis TaxID=1775926 RepID=A0ABP0ZW22_9ASCO
MDQDVEKLNNYPSADELKEIVTRNSSTPSFSFVIAIINYTIPQVYVSLSPEVQWSIRRVFRSLIGFGNLVNKLFILKDAPAPAPAAASELSLYWEILEQVFDEQLVPDLMAQGRALEVKEIDKLIFKGRVLSLANELALAHKVDKVKNQHLMSTDSYVSFLSSSVLSLFQQQSRLVPELFIHSILKFNHSSFNSFLKVFFHEQNWSYFLSVFSSMKSFQKREYVRSLLTGYLPQVTTESNITALYNILKFSVNEIDSATVESVITLCRRNLTQLVAMVMVPALPQKQLLSQLQTWSDPALIKSEPIPIQESRTFFLLALMTYLQATQHELLKSLPRNPTFLEGISNHLQANSNHLKNLGIVLADYVCELNGDEPIFKSANLENSFKHNFVAALKMNYLKDMSEQEAWAVFENSQGKNSPIEVATVQRESSKTRGPPMIAKLDSDTTDNAEPGTRKQEVPNPIYIRDLLSYILTDTKNSNAHDRRLKALLCGPALLKSKFQHGNEVEFYTEDLVTNLIGLENYYNDAGFEELKLQNLVAAIVTNPNATFHLFKLLLNGDYSIQQRVTMLSASGLAARELRGFTNDEDTTAITAITTIASPTTSQPARKQLPKNLHDKYMQLDTNTSSSTAPAKVPKFHKLISQNFFFPCLNVYYESGGVDIGPTITPIFLAHYIKTLSIFIHCAYPISSQLNDMCKEFLTLMCAIIRVVSLDEIQVVESVILGISLVFDVLDGLYMIQTFSNELALISTWLQDAWEGIIDDGLKRAAAQLLVTISETAKKYERTMIYQDGLL